MENAVDERCVAGCDAADAVIAFYQTPYGRSSIDTGSETRAAMENVAIDDIRFRRAGQKSAAVPVS